MEEVIVTCVAVASWFFGKNSVGRLTAREEGKRKEMLLCWIIETSDEDMDYSQLKELAAGTGAEKMVVENENMPYCIILFHLKVLSD